MLLRFLGSLQNNNDDIETAQYKKHNNCLQVVYGPLQRKYNIA